MYLYSNTSSSYRYGTFKPTRQIPYGNSEYTMLYNKAKEPKAQANNPDKWAEVPSQENVLGKTSERS